MGKSKKDSAVAAAAPADKPDVAAAPAEKPTARAKSKAAAKKESKARAKAPTYNSQDYITLIRSFWEFVCRGSHDQK